MKRIAFLPLALVPLLAAALHTAPDSDAYTFRVEPVGMRRAVSFTATAEGGTLERVDEARRTASSASSVVRATAPATLRASAEVRFLRVVTEDGYAVRVVRVVEDDARVVGWGRRILLRRDGDRFIPRSEPHFLDPR